MKQQLPSEQLPQVFHNFGKFAQNYFRAWPKADIRQCFRLNKRFLQ